MRYYYESWTHLNEYVRGAFKKLITRRDCENSSRQDGEWKRGKGVKTAAKSWIDR